MLSTEIHCRIQFYLNIVLVHASSLKGAFFHTSVLSQFGSKCGLILSFITAHEKFSVQSRIRQVFENLNSSLLEGCKWEISISGVFWGWNVSRSYGQRLLPSVKVLHIFVKIGAWGNCHVKSTSSCKIPNVFLTRLQGKLTASTVGQIVGLQSDEIKQIVSEYAEKVSALPDCVWFTKLCLIAC